MPRRVMSALRKSARPATSARYWWWTTISAKPAEEAGAEEVVGVQSGQAWRRWCWLAEHGAARPGWGRVGRGVSKNAPAAEMVTFP